jgi:dipeptidyl aminopeptidase/acylaminoacyl peptidase
MEKIKIEDFIDYRFISQLESNQTHSKVAYIVSKAVLDKNEYHHQLFVYDANKHQKIALMKNKSHYIWESNDSILYQYAKNKKEEAIFKEDMKTIYYRYLIHKNLHEPAYTLKMSGTIVKTLSESKLLIASFLDQEDHQLYQMDEKDRKAFLKKQKSSQNYEEIEEIPFYFNGQGFIANKRSQLFIYDVTLDQYFRLVDTKFNIATYKVSEDLEFIYYTGQEMTGIRSLTTQIYRYHVKSGLTDMLYLGNDFSIKNIYLIRNELIIAASDMALYGINQNPNFYKLQDKNLIMIKKFGLSLGNSIGSDVRFGNSSYDFVKNDVLYFITTNDHFSEILSLNLKGELSSIGHFDGSLDGICMLNEMICAVGLYQQNLQELYVSKKDPFAFKKVSKINRALSNRYVSKPKTFVVKKEGLEIKGWALLPENYNQSKSYPLILDIHGGPKTVYGKVYYHEMQVWANLGYVVCFCNPRGGDGKGDLFADIRGKYGTIDYEDIMDFLHLVMKKLKNIDQKALFLTGGSYGGFMTNWIIGHTQIFSAAVTQRSISNWLSFHGTSDIGFYFSKDQTSGNPITDTLKLWNQSPIQYVDQMKTPLLFIHSDQDYRCPIEQAMQLFTSLKERHVETKLVWIKGENHDLSRNGKPQARIKRLTEITNWFEKYRIKSASGTV